MITGLLLSRCANPVSPEGGSKDILPPRLIESVPPNHSIHFKSKQVKLTFDEFVQLKDQLAQITISPPALPKTEFKLRGKSIIIDIADNLLPNTTYTINFGKSILDITENNPAKNLRYVFSTGDFIDSLSLGGKVINAFDLTPVKDVSAMLYVDNNDTIPFDSLPLKVPPYYISKTDDQGEFFFTNISDKPFRLFALKDQNGNNFYDLPNEKIAFCDSLVHGRYIPLPVIDSTRKDSIKKDSIFKDTTLGKIDSIYHGYILRMFQESDTTIRLLKKESPMEGQLAFYFSNPPGEARFVPLQSDTTLPLEEYSALHDTVYLWLTRHQNDTLRFQVLNKGIVIDTVTFAPYSEKKKTKKKGPARLTLSSNLTGETLNHFHNKPVISSSYPLKSADFSKILLVTDKDTAHAVLHFTDSLHRKIEVQNHWEESKKYAIIIPDSILYSYTGLTNDSVIIHFKTLTERDYGTLILNVNPLRKSKGYIVQLMNEKENVFAERKIDGTSKVTFSYLTPGNYRVKIIFDDNLNGKWDPGNYSKSIQPEMVEYFPGKIEIRANWDVEENWSPD